MGLSRGRRTAGCTLCTCRVALVQLRAPSCQVLDSFAAPCRAGTMTQKRIQTPASPLWKRIACGRVCRVQVLGMVRVAAGQEAMHYGWVAILPLVYCLVLQFSGSPRDPSPYFSLGLLWLVTLGASAAAWLSIWGLARVPPTPFRRTRCMRLWMPLLMLVTLLACAVPPWPVLVGVSCKTWLGDGDEQPFRPRTQAAGCCAACSARCLACAMWFYRNVAWLVGLALLLVAHLLLLVPVITQSLDVAWGLFVLPLGALQLGFYRLTHWSGVYHAYRVVSCRVISCHVVCVCVCVYVCMRVYVCVCVCIYIYVASCVALRP